MVSEFKYDPENEFITAKVSRNYGRNNRLFPRRTSLAAIPHAGWSTRSNWKWSRS